MARALSYYRHHIANFQTRPEWDDRINNAVANMNLMRSWYKQFPCDTNMLMVLHSRECNNNRACQILNGERWDRTTKLVPRGVGPWGSAEEAMLYAIKHHHIPVMFGEMAEALEFIEGWNGWGYANKGLPSPYVWSGSNVYEKGKYVADGKYDPEAVDRQLGAGVLYMALNTSNFVLQPIMPGDEPAMTVADRTEYGSKMALQIALNDYGNYGLSVDGKFGPATKAAARKAFEL